MGYLIPNEAMQGIKTELVDGPIEPGCVLEIVTNAQFDRNIGANNIFVGQVRADGVEGREVAGIEFTSFEAMAGEVLHRIAQEMRTEFDLRLVVIKHSLGFVEAGQYCLCVAVGASHRDASLKATEQIVNKIKSEVPIWGKEVCEDGTHMWKINRL